MRWRMGCKMLVLKSRKDTQILCVEIQKEMKCNTDSVHYGHIQSLIHLLTWTCEFTPYLKVDGGSTVFPSSSLFLSLRLSTGFWTQLLHDVVRILPCKTDVLGVTAPRH